MINESDPNLKSMWLMILLEDYFKMSLPNNELNSWVNALSKYNHNVIKLALLRYRKEHKLDEMISEIAEYCKEYQEIEDESKR